jgi:FtsH-binding integral membrane protein
MLSRTLMVSSPEVIKTALIGTLSIFVTMFLFTIFLLMIGVNLDDRFGLILLFLFSLFIVYDTSNILTREEYIYNGDFITASMDYYLDIFKLEFMIWICIK